MEENVALDSTKQKQFVKSIKGLKKIIKKDQIKSNAAPGKEKISGGKIKKRKQLNRKGLVYLAHIPHGFYEHQMTEYFKQFGQVTNVRVIRSKRTGNSKGYAFVEFKEVSVAEVVAETMNNYLMGKRLIKAVCIPPEKQRKAFRKKWNSVHNPGSEARLQNKKAYNEDKDEKGELKKAKQILANLTRTKKKLSELGINYDFFKPVDVPEALQSQKEVKEEKSVEVINKNDKSINKKKKTKPEEVIKDKKEKNKSKKGKVDSQVEDKIEIVKDVKIKENKRSAPVVVDKKQQKQKQDTLKKAGVKPAEDFMKVVEESNDSDSSFEFDSDEYDRVMGDEDEFNSDVSSGKDSDDGDSDEEKSSEDDSERNAKVLKQKKTKGKKVPSGTMQKSKVKSNEVTIQAKSGKRKAAETTNKTML
ncbi:nucleolar phosphoprotein [Aphomia sociella]